MQKQGTVKNNIDGEEILKWMRNIAKIKSFGLVEIPLYRTDALARFVDIETLKDGYLILVYKVTKGSIYRNWIAIHSERFGNNGHCSTLSAISEATLMKSVMRYKIGNTVDTADGEKAIQEWVERFKDAAENGLAPNRNIMKLYMKETYGISLKEDYTLEDIINELKIHGEFDGIYEETYGGLTDEQWKNIPYQTLKK